MKIQHEEYSKIVERYDNNESVKSIAQSYDVNATCIYKIFDKLNVKTKNIKPSGRFVTPEEKRKEVIKLYQDGLYIYEVAQKVGISKNTVSRILQMNGIEITRFIRKSQFSDEEIYYMYDLYKSGMTQKEISKIYQVDETEIYFLFKKFNFSMRDQSHAKRNYKINENYFDVIDTQNKAYILGFLYADGCNHRKQNKISIGLQEEDKHILEAFRRELDTDVPLKFVDYHNKNINWKNIYRLTISNQHISEQLEKLGMVNSKSLILKFPEWLDKELVSHFIRGYFDGDGHVSSKQYCVNIVSTESFCLYLQNILNEQDIYSRIRNTYNKETSTRTLWITRKIDVKKFLDYIYKDAEMYLIRKHNIYEKRYC